jgi:hypothetical protein
MKKLFYFIAILAISGTTFNSCTAKKATAKAVGDKEIKIPCNDARSDKNYFRANNTANSTDLGMSRDMALFAAKDRLSGLIKTQMKKVSERYQQDRKMAGGTEFQQKFEATTREIINETLLDVGIICEKTMQKDDGSYNTFISLECSKETIYNGVSKGISSDQKLRQDYDAAKFRDVFNEEMDKLEKEQP